MVKTFLICTRIALISLTLAQVAFPVDPRTLTMGDLLGRNLGHPGANGGISDKCDNALNKCLKVVQEQDAQVEQLKKDQKALADKLVESQKQPLLPTWAWCLIAGLTGTLVGAKLLGK